MRTAHPNLYHMLYHVCIEIENPISDSGDMANQLKKKLKMVRLSEKYDQFSPPTPTAPSALYLFWTIWGYKI